ncbi:hypothetical protein JW851_04985 [Candidatus Woesearchaeota archaeon]|nr:hypothetical protein [Candidatus Woesearchaeota archaeon]
MNKKIIDIESHAFFRMLERGTQYGLEFRETKNRAYNTIKLGKLSKRKHFSKKHKTYYNYFNDNLSFYVICKEYKNQILIRTIIIEKGKE